MSFTLEKQIGGLKDTILIKDISITNGTLSYKEVNDENWTEITNYTKENKNETVIISKSGTYKIQLMDNTDSSKDSYIVELEVLLANSPEIESNLTYEKEEYDYSKLINAGQIDFNKIEEGSASAKDSNGNIYYWVPRFAYIKDADNKITTKFAKGISKITTDDIIINDDWTIPDEFIDDKDGDKTGVWCTKSEIQDLYVQGKKGNITLTYVTYKGNEIEYETITCKKGDTIELEDVKDKAGISGAIGWAVAKDDNYRWEQHRSVGGTVYDGPEVEMTANALAFPITNYSWFVSFGVKEEFDKVSFIANQRGSDNEYTVEAIQYSNNRYVILDNDWRYLTVTAIHSGFENTDDLGCSMYLRSLPNYWKTAKSWYEHDVDTFEDIWYFGNPYHS